METTPGEAHDGFIDNIVERFIMKTRLLAAALVAASTWVAFPAVNAAELVVRVGPPPVRYEPVPPARVGYAWAPGYWDWRGKEYVWVGGRYVAERPGYVYHAPMWVEDNGRWVRREERWGRRDDDRDGIPNGADRHPENPVRP